MPVPQVREGVRFDDPNGLPRIAWAYIKLQAQNKQALMREVLTAAASYMEQLDHEVSGRVMVRVRVRVRFRL